jgi:RHS repeat-associated protein
MSMASRTRNLLFAVFTLLIFSGFCPSVSAEDQTVFGPGDFRVSRWGIHLSAHCFTVDESGEGIIAIAKNIGDGEIHNGFVFLNGWFVPLRGFLRSPNLVLEWEVKLRSRNYLLVYLWGSRGASICMKVRQKVISPVNHEPSAQEQAVATDEDTPVFVVLAGSDPDGDILTYDVVSGPENGSLSGTAPDVTYMPDPDYYGADSFKFEVNDGECDSEPAEVVITVNPVNDPPVAGDDDYAVSEDGVLEVPAPGVLANDTDVDSMMLSIALEEGPDSGAVILNDDGSFSYILEPNFYGQDSFYYALSDEEGSTTRGTVRIVVEAVADVPDDVDYGLAEDEHQGGGGLVGETLRVLNGNVLEFRSDLGFPSANSFGLCFEAFYNSRSRVSGALGRGWTHTYSVSLDPELTIDGMPYPRILDATGRARYFLQESQGLFRGAFKERSRMSAQNGGYVWYRLDGTCYGFSDQGALMWMADEKGNLLELDYDGQWRLETVMDSASGRMLTFHYDDRGFLAWIEGPVTDAVSNGNWVSFLYDGHENLTSVTYADGSGFAYAYEDPADIHNLTEKRDKSNHLLNEWAYDSQDRATANFSVQGKGVSSIFYMSEEQVDVADPYGELRTYILDDFDGRKRLTALLGLANAPYSESNVVRWSYDENMQLMETESAGGAVTVYREYDERGNPGIITFAKDTPHESVVTFTYHPDMNKPTKRTESSVLSPASSKVTIWDYDNDLNDVPNENPTALLHRIVEQGFTKDSEGVIIPYEYITTFSYNAKGQVTAIDGPVHGEGDSTFFSYDDIIGNLLSMTEPLIGATEFIEYDAAGQLKKITDVNAQLRELTYDGRGRVVTFKNHADGSSKDIVYNLAGLPESVTDEDGVSRYFDYDTEYGRLVRITDSLGNYISYKHDCQGTRIEMSKHDPSGNCSFRQRWDYQPPENTAGTPGKLWKEIIGDRPATTYGYDMEGNIASIRDPKGNTTYYGYDVLNRLVSVEQPGGVTTQYAYDGHGNLASVTDAESHKTTYEYDDMARVVQTTSPDTGTVSYVYDPAGNTTQKADAKGTTVGYTYDILNRLTNVNFPDPAENIAYSYDAGPYGKGRRTGMTDPSGSTGFSYDARGRLVEKTSIIDGASFTVGATFTPGNKVSSVTYPSGRTIDIFRDSLGRMKDASTSDGSTTSVLIRNMAYRPFGGPSGMGTGSGGTVNHQSGECGCITVANARTDKERSYEYDHDGNLTFIVGTNTPWFNQGFTYDPLNRLVGATGRYGVINYTYDKVGNRLAREINSETEVYSYIPGTNKLESITGPNPITLSYDANGNTVGLGTKTLNYNDNNRLIQVEEGADILAEYTYNGMGQRVVKLANGGANFYHYDLNGKLIAESDGAGNMSAEYLYVGKIRVAMVDIATGAMYYYLNSKLGRPELMTDDQGVVAWEGIYKPFGETEVHPKSSVANNFRFPGQYYDQETGLHYNYHRYYDPKTGRYLTPDPSHAVQPRGIGIPYFLPSILHLPQELNLYPYVQNNPTNLADFEGLAVPMWLPELRNTRPGIKFSSPNRIWSSCEEGEENCLAKRLGIFLVCMGQTIATSQDEIEVCGPICGIAIVTRGAYMPANIACAACIGGAIWYTANCVQEASDYRCN